MDPQGGAPFLSIPRSLDVSEKANQHRQLVIDEEGNRPRGIVPECSTNSVMKKLTCSCEMWTIIENVMTIFNGFLTETASRVRSKTALG